MRRSAWLPYSRWTVGLILLGGLVACTAYKPQVSPLDTGAAPPPRKVELATVNYLGVPCYLHRVRWSEETLDVIARWYTGQAGNTRILRRITPNLRGNDLRPGDTVFIPMEVARRSDPMPRSYARRHGKPPQPPEARQPQPAAPEPDRVPADDGPPSPYGPRTFPD